MKSDCNNHSAMFVPDLKLISSPWANPPLPTLLQCLCPTVTASGYALLTHPLAWSSRASPALIWRRFLDPICFCFMGTKTCVTVVTQPALEEALSWDQRGQLSSSPPIESPSWWNESLSKQETTARTSSGFLGEQEAKSLKNVNWNCLIAFF